ncbi:MAG: tetratricopeptide repeat protein [Chthonomonadales bacterium]
MSQAPGPKGRIRPLIILLAVLGVIYLALWPTLNGLLRKADQINREVDAQKTKPVNPNPGSDATNVALKAATDNPTDIQSQMRAAMLLSEAGRLDDAEKRLLVAIQLQPDAVAPKLVLAETQRRARKYYDSVKTYRALVASHPTDPQAAVGLGSLYVSFGWTLDALETLKKGLAANPDSLEIKIALALASLQQDNMGEAVRLLSEVRKAKPESALMWAPIVDVYNKAHRYKEAIAAAKDALQALPDNMNVRNELGTAYLENGDFLNARSTFKSSLSAEPDNIPAKYGLAKTYLQSGKEPEAKQILESIHAKGIEFADSQLLLGQIYLRTGEVNRGRELLSDYKKKQAIAEKAKHEGYLLSNRTHVADSHWQMALAYKALGDVPHALLEVQRTHELDPKHVAASNELRRMLPPTTSK